MYTIGYLISNSNAAFLMPGSEYLNYRIITRNCVKRMMSEEKLLRLNFKCEFMASPYLEL